MAAGLGTRMRPFSEQVPKPLLPVFDVPSAQYSIDLLEAAGVRSIVANVHHMPDFTESGLLALELGEANLAISDERDLLLGSAGGLRKALPKLGEGPFYLLNADVLCDVNLQELFETHQRLRKEHGVVMTLTVFPKGPEGGKYRELYLDLTTGLINGMGVPVERRPFFVGAAVIEPEALAKVPATGPCDFAPTMLAPAIEARKAGFYLTSGAWLDIGSPSLWLKAHLEILSDYESGGIPNLWKQRLEAHNERLAPGLWVSKRSRVMPDLSAWQGPCYWSPGLIEGGFDPSPPGKLGPDAVLYGLPPKGQKPEAGIGFGGNWISR